MHVAHEKENAKNHRAVKSLVLERRKERTGEEERMLEPRMYVHADLTAGAHVKTVDSRLYKWLASNAGVSKDVLRPVEIFFLDIRQRLVFVRFSNLSLE